MTAPITSRFINGSAFLIDNPTPKLAERAYFDVRSDRALHSTATGESMADWGELYIREAKAIMSLGQRQGQLWERVRA